MPSDPLFPTPRRPRYETLDLWRGIACLMVVLLHSVLFFASYPLACGAASAPERHTLAQYAASYAVMACARGWWGVPIFFVISGYCITATVDSARRKSLPVTTYFARRCRRIVPPYWAAIALAAAAIWLVDRCAGAGLFDPSPATLNRAQWLGSFLLAERLRQHFTSGPTDFLLRQAWTLAYEEQFYIVFGLILLLARRHIFAASAFVTLAVAVVATLAGPLAYDPTGFFFDGYWFLFAAGILVYHALNHCTPSRTWLVQLTLAAGVAFYARHWPDLLVAKPNLYNQNMAVGLAFAMLLIPLRRFDDALARARWTRPLMWCGTMCYSLYLIHWPIARTISKAFARAGHDSDLFTITVVLPLTLAGSLLCSWLFHLAVERRFLNHTPRPRRTSPLESSPTPAPAMATA